MLKFIFQFKNGVVVDGLNIVNENDVTTASQSDLAKNNRKFGILLEEETRPL